MLIPLGLAQTIQNFIPFFVLIISYFALGETLRLLEVVNMCISFGSVIFIIWYSTKKSSEIDDEVELQETNAS
jgi:drug/metabolite transporter (DMT)-like permease